MKSFDLEAFKKGQKALTREGHVATFVGICEKCENFYRLLVLIEGDDQVTSYSLNGEMHNCIGTYSVSRYDLVSMVSRHQALIDAYDPEDAWQELDDCRLAEWFDVEGEPDWVESMDYRIHPHNDLIKAYRNGAKIEFFNDNQHWVDLKLPSFIVGLNYRIKPESTIHCLAYDAKHFDHEQTTAVRAKVVKKEVAQANGWTIIQEWEA